MKNRVIRKKLVYIIVVILIGVVMFISSRERNLMVIERPIKELVNSIILGLRVGGDSKQAEFLDFNLSKEREFELGELKDLLKIKDLYSEFTVIYARTINRNVSYWLEVLTIDKGEQEGIYKDMAVITGGGIIGKIVKSTKHFSEVKLLSSVMDNYQVSVAIKGEGNSYYGVLNKYDRKTNSYIVIGIGASSDIKEGSIVTTSGLGGIFPSGIVLGEVTSTVNDAYGISKTIRVKAIPDFNNIRYVGVLKKGE
ncbi:MAG: rod shape-determining protein MreC [Bacilli bacterium]